MYATTGSIQCCLCIAYVVVVAVPSVWLQSSKIVCMAVINATAASVERRGYTSKEVGVTTTAQIVWPPSGSKSWVSGISQAAIDTLTGRTQCCLHILNVVVESIPAGGLMDCVKIC